LHLRDPSRLLDLPDLRDPSRLLDLPDLRDQSHLLDLPVRLVLLHLPDRPDLLLLVLQVHPQVLPGLLDPRVLPDRPGRFCQCLHQRM